MIHLITGQPGAGKTLYALNYVKKMAEQGARAVYYSGINDLRLPWAELDAAEQWHTVPAGAIVVIDECQRVFRPRGNGSKVPAHVEALETHRHAGIDLVLITQHPMLADSNVRRLVGRHFHVVRSFGLQRSTVHEWGEVKEQCDKNRADSVRHQFDYPKEAFTWYKSAEVHTHKARIPPRLWFALAIPLLIGACVWGFVQWYSARADGAKIKEGAKALPAAREAAPANRAKLTTAEYIEQHKPRLEGLAYTAPVYDAITEPVTAPYPALCIASASKCKCYTEQSTPVAMMDSLCRQMARDGFFKAWADKAKPMQAQPAPPPSPGLQPAVLASGR